MPGPRFDHSLGLGVALANFVVALPRFVRNLAGALLYAFAGRAEQVGACFGGFVQEMLDGLASFARLLLNATHQLLDITVERPQIVIRKLGPLLLKLATDFVPVAG